MECAAGDQSAAFQTHRARLESDGAGMRFSSLHQKPSVREGRRSMNQGKLEVIKQEMARVNVDILGISELKWTGMGEFNSVLC